MDTVGDWMTSPAIVATDDIVLPVARQLLQTHCIRRLPVVDSTGVLVGIVTEGDINRLSDAPATDVRDYDLYHCVARLPLRDFMTRKVITVTPTTPVVAVALLLQEHRIGGLPVVEDGKVVGVISEYDLLRLFVAEHQYGPELLPDATRDTSGLEPAVQERAVSH